MNPQSIECDCGCWNIVVKVVPPGETCPCGDPRPHETCRAFPKRRPCDTAALEEAPKAKYNVFQFERCSDCGMLHPSCGQCPMLVKMLTKPTSANLCSSSSKQANGPNIPPTPPKPKPPKNILYRVASRPKKEDQGKPAVCGGGMSGNLICPANSDRCSYGRNIIIPKNAPIGCKMAMGVGGMGGCASKKPEVIIPHGGCKDLAGPGHMPGASQLSSRGCPRQITIPIAWCKQDA